METFLSKHSKEFRDLKNEKFKLSKRKDMNRLFKGNGNFKPHFDYISFFSEMDNEILHMKDRKIKNYLDICAAPGYYSIYVHGQTKANGTGITLPVADGGLKFDRKVPKYTLTYLDINKCYYLNKDKFDFIFSGCLDMTYIHKIKFYSIHLFVSTLIIGLQNLKHNGMFAFKTTMKYLDFVANVSYLFRGMFKKVKFFKSSKDLSIRSVMYIVGIDFEGPDVYTESIIHVLKHINDEFKKGNSHELELLTKTLMFKDEKIKKEFSNGMKVSFKRQTNAIKSLIDMANSN